MNGAKALLVFSVLSMTAVLVNGVGFSAPPTTRVPATNPVASKPAASQPAYPLWDGNETVAAYAKRAGIKDTDIILKLDGNVKLNLTLIPAGKFLMGSPDGEPNRFPDEGPQHEVTISKAFHMGMFEVTQEQYEQVMGKNPVMSHAIESQGAKRPVVYVSWEDAVKFCKNISQETGKIVRLPTEAEWEYACRAGSKTRFSFGDEDDKLGDYAWYGKNNGGKETHAVGQKKPNDWGLYDMHGNVWEWCSGWYDEKYLGSLEGTDPSGPASGSNRVLRGGSWLGDPRFCRSASRCWLSPDYYISDCGFRVVVDLK